METDDRLDAIDRRILQALQAQGRSTYDELAARVGLSASATLRRVKRLEESGVIAGYVALVAPERVGLGLTAYINVRLAKHSEQRSPIDAFAAAVQAWPEVVECAALTGEMDSSYVRFGSAYSSPRSASLRLMPRASRSSSSL